GQLAHGGHDLARAGDVELGAARGEHLGARLPRLLVQLLSQLPGSARDQQRQCLHAVAFIRPASARLRNGSHQLRLSTYQRTVAASPSVNGTAGRYPNAELILLMSTE